MALEIISNKSQVEELAGVIATEDILRGALIAIDAGAGTMTPASGTISAGVYGVCITDVDSGETGVVVIRAAAARAPLKAANDGFVGDKAYYDTGTGELQDANTGDVQAVGYFQKPSTQDDGNAHIVFIGTTGYTQT